MPVQPEKILRDENECFAKEIINKLKGKWEIVEIDDYSSSKEEDRNKWVGKKLVITENAIRLVKPIYYKGSRQKRMLKLNLDYEVTYGIQLYQSYVYCGDWGEGGKGYCTEEDYQANSSPFDWNVLIGVSYSLKEKSFSHLSYNIKSKKLRANVHGLFLGLILKKITPMEPIDFNYLEDCEFNLKECSEYVNCEGLVRENNSYLEKIKGKWKIFAVGLSENNFHNLKEDEKKELIGKKVSIDDKGFKFLTKMNTYSRYFLDYKCSSKNAIIIRNRMDKVITFIKQSNFDFFHPSKDLGLWYRGINGATDSFKGDWMKLSLEDDETVVVISNACKKTIFDTIIIGKNDKLMVLKIAGQNIFLKKLKKKAF